MNSNNNFTPIFKKYQQPYETQSWYYNSPNCTYSKYPLNNGVFIPPTQTNVFYFIPEQSSSTYYKYPNAYPAFPYMPCVFPNTSI
jgi:hypothetical protein